MFVQIYLPAGRAQKIVLEEKNGIAEELITLFIKNHYMVDIFNDRGIINIRSIDDIKTFFHPIDF